jgi:hypothetical protein
LALAEALYGGEQNLITINMSEYQEAHTVSTLKGAPPGYVGYGEGGVLTEAVRRKPYSVVLLDEVEKAHPDVHEMFFQVFDKGFMEDGEGRFIDFKNTLILLTTNAGTDLIAGLCKDPELMPDPDGMAKALRDLGKAGGQVKLIGFDSGVQSVRDLQNNDLQALVIQDPLKMGYLGVMTMVQHLQGKPVEKRIDTGVTLVTRDNMNDPANADLLAPPISKYLKD